MRNPGSTARSLVAANDDRRVRCVHPNGGFRAFTRDDVEQSITTMFERQVVRHPDRIAVKSRHNALTYDALNQAANGVARAIAAHRGPNGGGESVGLLFGQSNGAVAATIGALKAGRTYVPLEPSHPRDRLVAILNDANVTMLVTDTQHLSLVKELGDHRPLVNVDELHAAPSIEAPAIATAGTGLAAIFYTSGTTGKPKGVMQDHRSILHRVLIDTNTLHLCPDDRLSLLSPPTYSVSLRNLFGALLNGATVCPFDLDEEGLSHVARWLVEERVTILSATPTVFRSFTATLSEGDEQFRDVRLIDIGGEGALKSDVELYKRFFSPACIMANTLGCNEAGVYRRFFIDKHTEIDTSIVPVGYEVPDKEVVVLVDGVEAGANQVGEIGISSSYLPRGYWRRPDLTDATFVADPRGGHRRLYLTGDLGELLPDGCLLYRGRKDTRIKIRGQAVDLSELEATLLQHDGVKEAVVRFLERPGNGTHLVAFVVRSNDSTPTTRSLRRFLARTLPAFMLPSKFVFLAALPRLANGKIDRQALRVPDDSRTHMATIERAGGPEYLPPRETIEHQLVQIWEELLRVHPIGLRDNFFDLGGDSLRAMQMMEEVQSRCGEAVPVSALLGAATLGELAQTLVEQRIHRRDSLIVQVQSGESAWPFFFLHGDFHGGGFYCLNLARALGPEQRFYALTPHGLGAEPVPPTIEAMAASYIEMIQRVEPEGPYLLGGLCHAGLIAYEMARQLERKGQRVGLVAMIAPPAWNPPHWAWVKDAVAALVRLRGGTPEEVTDLFLALRDRRIRWRQFCEYAGLWVKEILNLSRADRVAGAVRVARRIVSGAVVSERPWAEPIAPTAHDDHVMLAYRRAVASYVRRPYSGEVAIFWPREVPVNPLGGPHREWASAPEPSLGWRKVAPHIAVHAIPGDYTTSITKHVHILVNRMKASITDARTDSHSGASSRVRDVGAGARV